MKRHNEFIQIKPLLTSNLHVCSPEVTNYLILCYYFYFSLALVSSVQEYPDSHHLFSSSISFSICIYLAIILFAFVIGLCQLVFVTSQQEKGGTGMGNSKPRLSFISVSIDGYGRFFQCGNSKFYTSFCFRKHFDCVSRPRAKGFIYNPLFQLE